MGEVTEKVTKLVALSMPELNNKYQYRSTT